MSQRLNYWMHMPKAFEKFAEVESLLKESGLSHNIIHLVKLRASQINGCTYCVDMHVKEAVIDKIGHLKLHHVAAWKESNLFDEKERAALMWTEALTTLSFESTRDEIYNHVREFFSEKEIVELSVAITMINAWNRFGVSFRSTPGTNDKAMGLDKAGL